LIQDAEDRSIAVSIHQSLVSSIRLELFPKSTIDVFLTIIENDGIDSCVATGTVAASTALADAGVEMLGLVTSCAAVRRLRNSALTDSMTPNSDVNG
jgi:exosome complex component MTR3